MRVICEYQAYVEEHLMSIVEAVFARARPRVSTPSDGPSGSQRMHARRQRGAHHRGPAVEIRLGRGRELLRRRHGDFPGMQLLRRALERQRRVSCPPASCPWKPIIPRWAAGSRASGLPGYERTYPPHWRPREALAPLTRGRRKTTKNLGLRLLRWRRGKAVDTLPPLAGPRGFALDRLWAHNLRVTGGPQVSERSGAS